MEKEVFMGAHNIVITLPLLHISIFVLQHIKARGVHKCHTESESCLLFIHLCDTAPTTVSDEDQ